jgi:hypothetical protein
MIQTESHFLPSAQQPFLLRLLDAIPAEGLAITTASFTLSFFSQALAAPLFHIGISMFATQLVLKAVDCYDDEASISLAKEAYRWNKNYPKLQVITLICAYAISLISKIFSIMIASCLGGFRTILLDIEDSKRLQQANRQRMEPLY